MPGHPYCRAWNDPPGTSVATPFVAPRETPSPASEIDAALGASPDSGADDDVPPRHAPPPPEPDAAAASAASPQDAQAPPASTLGALTDASPQRIALLGTFAIAGIAALHAGQSFLLPVIVAVLLSLLLSPAVGALERLRVPRSLGALVVLLASIATVGALATHLTAPAQEWLAAGPEQVDELRRKFRLLRQPVDAVKDASDRVAEIAADEPAARPREVVIERRFAPAFVDWAKPVAISVTSVLILLYFLLASGDLFLRKLIRVTPRLRDKIRAIEIARSVQHRIGRYFASITAINAGLGLVVALTMGALGMPTPALIGTIVAVLNFVPYLGPLVSLVLITLVSTVTFDAIGPIVLPPAVFLAITTIEGQVIQPIVLGRQLSTAAVTMFLWVMFWGWLWGVGGVAVAVPLLVAVKICAEHIPSWSALAELLGRD